VLDLEGGEGVARCSQQRISLTPIARRVVARGLWLCVLFPVAVLRVRWWCAVAALWILGGAVHSGEPVVTHSVAATVKTWGASFVAHFVVVQFASTVMHRVSTTDLCVRARACSRVRRARTCRYLLSQGVVVPMFYGNFYINGGSLRASSAFPSTDYLITIGHSGCNPDYAASCNEFIGISNVLLDGSHTAAGGLQIVSAMGVTVGPAVFVERFVDVGIRVDGG
jgi:hypothetical protein